MPAAEKYYHCSPPNASSPIRPPSPAPAHPSGSWPPVLSCPSPMTWAAIHRHLPDPARCRPHPADRRRQRLFLLPPAPQGPLVKTSAGQATGPVGFLRVYDHAFGEVAQGGTRRGANMAVLRVDHPDIEDFITCKTNENQITNFNISVGITDAFMRAVENDDGWDLRFPDVTDPRYRGFDGTLEQARDAGMPIKVYKRVRARDLFDKIVQQSHHNGEPGVLFLDAANRTNPVPAPVPARSHQPLRRAVAWDPTRTAAWVRSTWPSTSAPTTGWIGTSCAKRWRPPPASWITWWTPTSTCRPCPS